MLFSQLGYYFLIFGFILSISIFPIAYKDFKITNNFVSINIFNIVFFQLISVFFSFVFLIISFVNSDFSNEIVYNNSHTTKPLFYKISGTWGNHEGSLLLCLLVLILFIFLFLLNSKKEPKKYRIYTLLFQQIIIFGFFLFLLTSSNPFNKIYPIPFEGLGLNPILQDPILAIHPPILYLGYIGSSIIFSSSLAAIIQNYVNNKWAENIKTWILLSWFFLTIGIMLGSIWAYYELGWGGFWFWDPVENVSLMPWLCLTALLHSIIVLQKRNSLATWTLILSISTFTLSMSGTFLVRSGILNSVHTFANDPKRGLFILIFLFFLILLSLFIFFILYKPNIKETQNNFFFNKETSILINNLFMMYFLSSILIGTVYPIFLEVITNEKISVGPPFYQKLLTPFLIPFLIIMAIGPNTKWIKHNLSLINVKLILLFFFCVLISYFIIIKTDSRNLLTIILIGSTLFLFFNTAKDFFVKKHANLSQKISHFSFSLLVLSIILNGVFSSEIITNIKVGEKYNYQGVSISFEKINTYKKQNYTSVIGTFKINDNNNIIYLKPELRIFNKPVMITSEADIKTTLLRDNFLVMNLVKDDDFYNIRYQVKPFMLWIWLSTILIAFGGLLKFYLRE